MTLANLPQDNCFMTLPKPTGTDNGYFTIGMLPPALSIPQCEIAPDFAKFKEVTTTNTNLLADMLTEFQLALVAAGKSGAVAVYPPLADTSFHGVEARWRKMIANRSMVGHHWASMSISAGGKESDRLLEATLNRFWHRMTLNRTPMPPGGYAPIYLCFVLFCDGKITSDTPNTQVAKCTKFLGHSHTYGVICTHVVTSKDKRKSCQSGCQNGCSFCDGCIQVLHASTCTSAPGAEASKITVRCFCGDDVLLVTLEGTMTTKGLQVDYIVLKVASQRSLQRNLSRSKTQRLPGPTAFALGNFPVTDNGEDELVDYLEARLADVLVDASFLLSKKRDGAHF